MSFSCNALGKICIYKVWCGFSWSLAMSCCWSMAGSWNMEMKMGIWIVLISSFITYISAGQTVVPTSHQDHVYLCEDDIMITLQSTTGVRAPKSPPSAALTWLMELWTTIMQGNLTKLSSLFMDADILQHTALCRSVDISSVAKFLWSV